MKKSNIILYRGDNKDIIPSLKNLKIKPNLIYLDPPYNTKNKELIYKDFSKSKSHWFNSFKKRLILIKEIIQENSVIFTSIGHEELANAKIALSEVFGENSFSAIMPRITYKTSKTSNTISRINDFLIIYTVGNIKFKEDQIREDDYKLKDEFFKERGPFFLRPLDYRDFSYSKSLDFVIKDNNQNYYPSGDKELFEKRKKNALNKDWCWLWSRDKVEFAIKNKFLTFKGKKVYKKTYLKSKISKDKESKKYKIFYFLKRGKPFSSLELTDIKYMNSTKKRDKLDSLFSYPKSENLIQFIFELPILDKKVILDPYAGSAISAKISSKLNIDCILIQKDEEIKPNTEAFKKGFKNIYELTKEILKEEKIEFIEREKNEQ